MDSGRLRIAQYTVTIRCRNINDVLSMNIAAKDVLVSCWETGSNRNVLGWLLIARRNGGHLATVGWNSTIGHQVFLLVSENPDAGDDAPVAVGIDGVRRNTTKTVSRKSRRLWDTTYATSRWIRQNLNQLKTVKVRTSGRDPGQIEQWRYSSVLVERYYDLG